MDLREINKMANGKGDVKGALGKSSLTEVPSTPGKNGQSPVRKLQKKAIEEQRNGPQCLSASLKYAVKNEQYSRKNNLRIHGLEDEEGET